MNNMEKLNKKLEKEYTEFLKEMRNKPKDDIIKGAYEITVKEELKDTIGYMNLHPTEIQALLNEDNVLTEFYHDWLDEDSSLGEVLENSIGESIAILTRYFNKNNKER